MPISERAKQFSPFAAIKGLDEALRKKEKIHEARLELSEESSEEINDTIRRLHKGTSATITYYNDYEYLKKSGKISKIDRDNRCIIIDDVSIEFHDIIYIHIDDES